MDAKASFRPRICEILAAVLLGMSLSAWAMAQDAAMPQMAPQPCPQPCPQEPCWPPPCQDSGPDRFDVLKSACPDKSDLRLTPPRLCWYAEADDVAMRRDRTDNVDFAAIDNRHNVVLSTRDLDGDYAWAGRFLVGHTLNECIQIEALYIGVSEATSTATVSNDTINIFGSPGSLLSPFGGFGAHPIANLDYNDLARVRFKSSMQNAELYIRRQLPMPPDRLAVSVLFGVRYMDLPEQLDYFTHSGILTPTEITNSIRVTTNNRMVGPEIGALFELYCENRWWLNFEAKAALMENVGSQSTAYHYTDPLVDETFFGSRKETHTAFVGDLALTLVYRWSPHFTTKFGYQAIWAGQLASAAENLNTDINVIRDGPAQVTHTGSAVFHGPQAGIIIGW